ncbi:MAG: ATP-binding protein, partial [Gemmatimonadetes bacterium]
MVPASLPLIPFVGRAAELGRLRAALDAGGGGSCSAVFLSGPTGVGKSRLAEAARQEARRRAWRVLEARAYPIETDLPYGLLTSAYNGLLRDLDAAALADVTRGVGPELGRVFPALAARGGGGVVAGPGTGDSDLGTPGELRARLRWSVVELTRNLAREQPVLLYLDDLHWGDASSLDLVHFLLRHSRDVPLCVAATRSRHSSRLSGPTGTSAATGRSSRSRSTSA